MNIDNEAKRKIQILQEMINKYTQVLYSYLIFLEELDQLDQCFCFIIDIPPKGLTCCHHYYNCLGGGRGDLHCFTNH